MGTYQTSGRIIRTALTTARSGCLIRDGRPGKSCTAGHPLPDLRRAMVKHTAPIPAAFTKPAMTSPIVSARRLSNREKETIDMTVTTHACFHPGDLPERAAFLAFWVCL